MGGAAVPSPCDSVVTIAFPGPDAHFYLSCADTRPCATRSEVAPHAQPARPTFVRQPGQGEGKAQDGESAETPQVVAFFSSWAAAVPIYHLAKAEHQSRSSATRPPDGRPGAAQESSTLEKARRGADWSLPLLPRWPWMVFPAVIQPARRRSPRDPRGDRPDGPSPTRGPAAAGRGSDRGDTAIMECLQ
jgi:hypothetical protein